MSTDRNSGNRNFLFDVIEAAVVAVGDDTVALLFEVVEVVDDSAAKEGVTVFQCRFIDDHLGAFGFHPFNHALNATLAEIVTIALHRQTVYAYNDFFLAALIPRAVGSVVSGFFQYLVGDEVFSGAIAVNNSLDEILGHVCIVG